MTNHDRNRRGAPRRGSAGRIARATDQRLIDRAVSAVAWYTPELATAGASAGAAVTVWAPFGVVSAAVCGWIVSDQVLAARRTRAARRMRADQLRLDEATATTQPLKLVQGEHGEWEVAG